MGSEAPSARFFRAAALAAATGTFLAAGFEAAHAQAGAAPIALDHTLGPPGASLSATALPQGHASYTIPSSAGARAGGNLFHSFARFGIPAGDAATFTQDTPGHISNILARVTGGAASHIAGTLRSEVPGADLYLLNPAGVVFAPGAVVDVPAGLHVSTASHVRMEDGSRFSAIPEPGEVLSASAPAAFGFLGPMASPIEITGATITARAGSLSLVGGSDGSSPGVDVRGGVVEQKGGDILLASVTSPGELALAHPEHAREGFASLGPLVIQDGARVQASDLEIDESFHASGAGRIDLVGGDVAIRGASTLVKADGISGTSADGIHVAADSFTLDDGARLVTQAVAGKAPPVTIGAGTVIVRGGGQIHADTDSAADAGDVTIDAVDSILVRGREAGDHGESGVYATTTAPSAGGRGGRILLRAPEIAVERRGIVTARTRGSGDAGEVSIEARTLRVEGASRGLEFLDGEYYDRFDVPRIEASARGAASGGPGRIDVVASERVMLSGWDRWDEERAGLYVMPRDRNGDAERGSGILRVETPLLEVRDRATLNAMSQPGGKADAAGMELRVGRLVIDHGRVTSTSQGSGRAGTLDVEASDLVQILDGTLESDTFGSGQGGLVHVKAPRVRLEDYGEISSESQQVRTEVPGGGDSGTVLLDVGRLEVDSRGRILTNARGEGGGGLIHVRAAESVDLDAVASDGVDSARIISLAEGNGAGGDVVIETPRLRVGTFSRIETSSNGSSGEGSSVRRTGRAGNIWIRADDVLVESHARIASDSHDPRLNEGPAGTITLDVRTLRIPGSGEIGARTSTRGAGGQLVVHASESIVIEALGGHHFGIETTTEIEDGAAGSVEVETPLLVLAKGGSIGATSTGAGRAGPVTVRADRVHISGGSEIASDARGTGDAGPVRLRVADRLVVDGVEDERPSGVFSRTFGPARGASVAIDARRVELRNGGTIAASSTGTGDAGDVTVAVTDDLLARAGVISTSAPLANGGNITLRAGDRIELHGSRVAADVGSGRGGNVLLAPTTLLLLDGSAITAQAGSGQGGAIRIVADAVVQALDATVSASAGAAGIDGTVTFETPGLDYTAPLQALPAEFVDAVTLLHARCAERHGARASFVVDLAAEPKPGPERLLPVAIRDPGDDPESGPVVLVLEPAGEEGAWRARCDG